MGPFQSELMSSTTGERSVRGSGFSSRFRFGLSGAGTVAGGFSGL